MLIDNMRKIDKKKIEDIFALTPMQEGMLFHYLKDPESEVYFEQLNLEIEGDIDTRLFQGAWNFVIETNEMLRVFFRWEKLNQPAQVVLKEHKVHFVFHDLSTLPNNSVKSREVEKIKKEDRERAFDLRQVPFRVILCKIQEKTYQLIISHHHIFYDGWSTGLILKEFFAAYHEAGKGKPLITPVKKPQFKEFVKWYRGQDRDKQKKFWETYLQGFDTQTELPVKRKRKTQTTGRESTRGHYRLTLGKKTKDSVERFIKFHRVTLAAFFYTTWGILLQKYGNTDDVIFGTTVSGRSAPIQGIENMVGLLINTVPLRVKTEPGETAADLTGKINAALSARKAHENTPLVDIKGCSQLGTGEELFDSLVVMQNYPLDNRLLPETGNISIRSHSAWENTNYDVNIAVSTATEGCISVDVIYHRKICKNETIERLVSHFKNIMEKMVTDAGTALHEIDMLSEEEKKQLLMDFNHIGPGFPNDKTIPELFLEQVEKHPGSTALVNPLAPISFTYRELNRLADGLAGLLKSEGLRGNQPVGLMAERSVEMIIGLLAILKADCGYVPLNPKAPAERTTYILNDCNTKFLLTTRRLLPNEGTKVGKWEGKKIFLETPVNLHAPCSMPHAPCSMLHASPENLAYVIYTSGSTGKPKGVPITHSNFSPLMHWGYERLGISTSDRVAQNLSYYFDWSVWEIFITLTSGAALYVVPEEIVLDAERYIDYINRNQITVLHITPTHFQSLVHRCEQKSIVLKSLKYLAIGAEKLTDDLVRRSYELIEEECRVFNMYGPTEATIMSAVLEIHRSGLPYYSELSSVPIGKTLGNLVLLVLDRHLNPCPIHVPGELYIGGDGISRGYLNNPELTSEKFPPAGGPSYPTHPLTYSPLYRTGDRARWLPDGTVEFLGRIDQQVKIRGFRIEPGEVEKYLLEHAEVKEALVMARENQQGEKYLCAYAVPQSPHSPPPPHSLRDYLCGRLPDYMVPAHFVLLEKMPLNPNGKVDTRVLPEPGVTSVKGYIAPRSDVEKKLVDTWARVLETDKNQVGIDDDYFELGGHSLNVTRLIGLIHKELNIQVPFTEIFVSPTVRELAAYISQQEESRFDEISPVEKKEYYPLSSAQERVFVLQQMDVNSTVYNIHGVMLLEGAVDKEAFEAVFRQLISRHESLRTSFHMAAGVPVQQVHDKVKFEIECPDEASLSLTPYPLSLIPHFIRPFDLSSAPLFRVALVQLENKESLLMVDMHHIISDGTSMGVLVKEFMALYEGQALPSPGIQYKDFSEWHNLQKKSQQAKQQEKYWLHQFSGELPLINLPADFPRPAVQSFAGAHIRFEINQENTKALKALALEENATLYGVLVVIFNILLAKLSSQEDIVIGTPVMGRRHTDLSHVMGMFVNTLALRQFPSGEKSFRSFVREVRDRISEAFDNQEYPFEDLVEKVAVNRDASRNPLFDVMFAMQNVDIPGIQIPGLHLKPYPYDDHIAKFDLVFICENPGESLHFTVEYCSKIFREDSIKRFINYFKKIVLEVMPDRRKKLGEIEIISPEEKQDILSRFNNFESGYVKNKTIPQLFEEQVERTPHQVALMGPNSGYLSYKEFNEISLQLAHFLCHKGVKPGELVGFMVERSLEMIIGMLAILKAGGAYVPLNPKAPAARNQYILEECSTDILLTTRSLSKKITFGKDIVYLDQVSEVSEVSGESPLQPTHPSKLCYIIFTSGSTGKPKGVPITHANLSPLLHWGCRHLGIGTKDRALQNLAYYFDWSVWEIFIALTTGASLYMVSEPVLLDAAACVEYINTHALTVLHVTPTQYQYIVYAPTRPLTLKYLFIGAEKLTYDLVKCSLASVSETCRVFNMYGPTEATIISAALEINRADYERFRSLSSVPIGRPTGNTNLLILDNYLNMCPVNIPGELYISGDCLARGYLNDAGKTTAVFIPNPYQADGVLGERLYRTGDLARWLKDGNVQYLGRIDHQVKIRGFRIELGEIENQLLTHEKVKEAVVIDQKKPGAPHGKEGEKYLCAYIVYADGAAGDLNAYLSQSLPDYMIPSYFIPLENIPLNPNGKVDRKALPAPETVISATDTAYTDNYKAPRNPGEKKLAAIWTEILQPPQAIGIDDNFFEIGGHSLKATLVISKIHEVLDVKLHLTEIFVNPTIRQLAASIKTAAKDRFLSIKPTEVRDHYPLSSAQKRLYLLQRIDPEGIEYNIPVFRVVEGHIDKKRLADTFLKLIQRHESLRTSFFMKEGEPVQKIHHNVEFEIQFIDAAPDPLPLISQFIRSFDLSRAPLLRVGLVELENKQCLLMMDMHHIISDGTSMGVFVEEFMDLYKGETLPEPGLQYRDFALWQHSKQQEAFIKQQEEYWLKQFEGEIPVLNLPYDFARPQVQSFEGNTLGFEIGETETTALNRLAIEKNTTLYMVLISIFNILLSKISGQEDISIGTPVAGRSHPDIQRIIGMFINTLALRNFPSAEKRFIDFITEIKERTLQAFENQEYPFEDLVDKISVRRDTGRNPLFDVVFILQNMEYPEMEIPGLKLAPYESEGNISKFDMTLTGVEVEDRLLFTLEYCTRLFKKETAKRFTRYFKAAARSVLNDPGVKISGIEIIPGEEKQKILYDFNNTEVEYPSAKTIHELFEEQVEKTPGNIALIFEDKKLSYKELEKRSNQLAMLLRNKGMKPGSIVGIFADRSLELMVAIFSVLKAGGIYLPLGPNHPGKRIEYMLKASNTELVLTNNRLLSNREYTLIDINNEENYATPSSNPVVPGSAGDPAYVIYTSGTTGVPKGVVIENRSVVNFIKGMTDLIDFRTGDSVLSLTTVSFDIFGLETIVPLTRGATVVMGGVAEQMDPGAAASVIRGENVTVFQLTPSRLQLFLSHGEAAGSLKPLRYLLVGGEAFPQPLLEKTRPLVQGKIYNLYGPTETTIWSTVKDLSGKAPLNIGKPIANTGIYILDKYLEPVPMGVVGEIYIGGDGVGRGYLNRPELTAEVFNRSYKSYRTYIFYKTGDLGRWLPDGDIECLGRVDHQVKIRGFRVELEEIEQHLAKHEAVKEAVVTPKGDENGNHYLCAYFVVNASWGPDQDHMFSLILEMKNHLTNRLPGYMVPSYFMPLEKMPLTATGKIDRKALPVPDRFPSLSKATYAAPRTDLEKTIGRICAEVLKFKIDMIGVEDNFFDLGGHSLDIIRIAGKLSETLNREIPVLTLFAYPTIRSLAQHLGQEEVREHPAERKIRQSQKLDKAKHKKKKAAERMRRKRT